MKNKPSLKAVISLTSICLITALILAVVNYITSPIIEKAEYEKEQAALKEVLPSGEDFKSLDPRALSLDEKIVSAYSEKNGGYIFKITVTGYKSGMTVLCGIGSDGKVDGAVCLSSSETLEWEKTYGERFGDISLGDVMSVDTVAGATKTTSAYREAVKLALEAFDKLTKEAGE